MRTGIESASGLPAMYFRKKTSGGRAYLQIVESRREGAAVRQQVIATLASTSCNRTGSWTDLRQRPEPSL